ncbi:MAG TPA: aldo/keto reductase [Armatimonadota bacterium]|nr:aldo/keto reductase [Armatimonadota bacterium]
MKYRQLGRTGTRVSELCLGTMNFGGRTDEATSIRIIDQAIDAGINFIDSADVYARGVSEEILGKALQGNGHRDDVVVATKAVANMGDGPNDHGASRYHLTRAVEGSLRRLQTDRIDLFYLHIVDLTTPMDEILGTLDVLVQQGKLLYVGTSKWPPTLIMEGLALADAHGLPRFVAEQPPYQMLDRGIENELVWMCMRQGIGICPWGPLAYGMLSGRYRKGQPPPEGGRMSTKDPDTDSRFTHAALDAIEEYVKLAEARGVPLAEFAHAWLLTRPGLSSVIIGPRTEEHLASALRSVDLELTEEELARVDEIVPPGKWVSDFYDGNVYARMRKMIGTPDEWRKR